MDNCSSLLGRWGRNFNPSEYAYLCELNFQKSDFKTERDDKTRGRLNKRGKLVHKYSKPGSYPTKLPGSSEKRFTNSSTTGILKAKCNDGHCFSTFYERIINTFFNGK